MLKAERWQEGGTWINAIRKKFKKKSTKAETLMWSRLRAKQMSGIKLRRQQTIGNFIVDFVSFKKQIAIELDRGQHARQKAETKDDQRDRFLKENGFEVLRLWDNEVFGNLEGVLEAIREKCV